MIVHYGYRDGEGEFYITVDQDRCAECEGKPCVAACPRSLLTEEEDPYGESVVAVDEQRRKRIRYECMQCKPTVRRPALPCVSACPFGAIDHSW